MDKAKKMSRRTKSILIKRLDKLSRLHGLQGKEPIKGQKRITAYFGIVEGSEGSGRKRRVCEERRREMGPKVDTGNLKSGKKGK